MVRWSHPVMGMISPVEFISIAEDTGQIVTLGRWILRRACKDFAELRNRMIPEATVSVNISAIQLLRQEFVGDVETALKESKLPARCLVMEMTESVLVENPQLVSRKLSELEDLGVHVALDDFGTGYSSMVQLARLPFSEIKIDKSFVMTAASSKESRTVIKAIIELGHGLGLYASAEGIETAETLEYLRNMGCDLAQGFHVARPMPGGAVLDWLREGRNEDEAYRLQVLRSLKILDSEEDERIDRVTALAARLFDVPIALFSLVDSERQWFKSSHGLETRETPRSVSFCSHAICGDDVMVVADATDDERFRGTALVTGEPYIRFYAGSPIHAGS
ncbi:MAG TPA: diguanylate cyclase, partial [Pseudohongiella sp.]|nr:diguanylate cyclase [Pseudohongiella sp.]